MINSQLGARTAIDSSAIFSYLNRLLERREVNACSQFLSCPPSFHSHSLISLEFTCKWLQINRIQDLKYARSLAYPPSLFFSTSKSSSFSVSSNPLEPLPVPQRQLHKSQCSLESSTASLILLALTGDETLTSNEQEERVESPKNPRLRM